MPSDIDNPDLKTFGEKDREVPGEVRFLKMSDLDAIQKILCDWIKDDCGNLIEEEVTAIMQNMSKSVAEGVDRFLVTTGPDAKPAGVVGFRTLDEETRPYARTENPAELINLYVKNESRGQGYGKKLVAALEKVLEEQGYSEVVLSSGPRYKESGWGFYDSLEGFERTAVLNDYFGVGRDAVVWSKVLN